MGTEVTDRLHAQLLVKQLERYEPDPIPYCSHFGCRRVLTLTEQLAGSKCTGHMKERRVDAALITKHS